MLAVYWITVYGPEGSYGTLTTVRGTNKIHTDEKSSISYLQVIVLQTDTGGLAEKAKALEITLAKELGKMVP